MFGSGALEVAIGVVFVYLLLSLVCSAANELIEAVIKSRAKYLEDGIYELLRDNSVRKCCKRCEARWRRHSRVKIRSRGPAGTGVGGVGRALVKPFAGLVHLVRLDVRAEILKERRRECVEACQNVLGQALFTHPIIGGLYRGGYPGRASFARRPLDWLIFENRPSYILDGTFAQALWNIVTTPHEKTHYTEEEMRLKEDGAGGAPDPQPAQPAPQGGAGLEFPIIPGMVSSQPDPQMAEAKKSIERLRNESVRRALLTVLDGSWANSATARGKISEWYKGAMDRVSGRYKRRTQTFLLLLALAFTLLFNVNTVIIANYLGRNDVQRKALVARAEGQSRSEEMRTLVQGLSAGAKPDADATPDPKAQPNQNAAGGGILGGVRQTPPVGGGPGAKLGEKPPAQTGATTEGKGKSLPAEEELKALDLPIGWPGVVWYYEPDFRWKSFFLQHLLGWLLTAIAVSLGAPFWFDVLNKFVVVRSTVKPFEKSGPTPSKDQQADDERVKKA